MNLDEMIKAGWITYSGWQMLFHGTKPPPPGDRQRYEAEMRRRLQEAKK